ncbi:MAG: transposase [Dehalococcoidia bacterium]
MEQYYLGIDASKGYADFTILDAKKRPVEEVFQLDDTFDGHCCLYTKLSAFCNAHPGCVIYAGMESTGGYESNWFHVLLKFQGMLSIETARLNPFGVSANSKADLRRITTDEISAQNVAEYLISHPEKVTYQQQDYLAPLRKQWKFVNMLTKQSTQLLNQLNSLVYTSNPELLSYCKDEVPMWVLKLLSLYPTASELAEAQPKALAQIPYITTDRANQLIAAAQKSVASSTDRISAQVIAATAEQIINLKRTIAIQIEMLSKECTMPEVDLIKTFPGIGDYSAIGLMLEIQAIERFPSVKKLAAHFGIHPVFKTSGDGSSGFRMSKQGRKEPRRILFMVALNAIKSNPLIRDLYEKKVGQGLEKMAAIGVFMHKILRIIYGMLKNNKPFDPEIDRQNRMKTVSRPTRIRQVKNRRYQAYDPKAPISRRQTTKRKERKQSHSSNKATKSGIIVSVP